MSKSIHRNEGPNIPEECNIRMIGPSEIRTGTIFLEVSSSL
jgi:hypothetical protein